MATSLVDRKGNSSSGQGQHILGPEQVFSLSCVSANVAADLESAANSLCMSVEGLASLDGPRE